MVPCAMPGQTIARATGAYGRLDQGDRCCDVAGYQRSLTG